MVLPVKFGPTDDLDATDLIDIGRVLQAQQESDDAQGAVAAAADEVHKIVQHVEALRKSFGGIERLLVDGGVANRSRPAGTDGRSQGKAETTPNALESSLTSRLKATVTFFARRRARIA